MYAIVVTDGKQYKVSEGDIIRVEKLGVETGQTVTSDQVLVVSNGEMTVGAPTVSGANVSAIVPREAKTKKAVVHKYKAKLGYHKKNDHRQPCTQVKIDKISV